MYSATLSEFDIVENSPSVRLFRRLNLESGENFGILKKAILFSFITWLPLLIITAAEGTALGNHVKIPFLYDYVTYTRFFISLPILFFAEKLTRLEVKNSVFHIAESGLLKSSDYSAYGHLVSTFTRLLNSKTTELVILILVYAEVVVIKAFFSSFEVLSSWKFFNDGSGTAAYYYYTLVSLPILQFFLTRIVWRFLLWAWFLFRISRMKLDLVPCHPDRAGGLGFLPPVQVAFAITGMAQTASISAGMCNSVIYSSMQVDSFKITVLVTVAAAVLFYLFPMYFFSRKLVTLKLKGILHYGSLAQKYSNMFHEKWIKSFTGDVKNELLGAPDIQSLNDLAGSYQIVTGIRFTPMIPRYFIIMILMIAVSFLPLLMLKIPAAEILRSLGSFIL